MITPQAAIEGFKAKTARELYLAEYSMKLLQDGNDRAGVLSHIRVSIMNDHEVMLALRQEFGYAWTGSQWLKSQPLVPNETHEQWVKRVFG